MMECFPNSEKKCIVWIQYCFASTVLQRPIVFSETSFSYRHMLMFLVETGVWNLRYASVQVCAACSQRFMNSAGHRRHSSWECSFFFFFFFNYFCVLSVPRILKSFVTILIKLLQWRLILLDLPCLVFLCLASITEILYFRNSVIMHK